MHASSLENMQKCYERYIARHAWGETVEVIDIGGANVNGSYADIFSVSPFRYRGVDIAEGEGVDIVLDDPYVLPFADGSIDILISGQAFEHVEFFWKLFEECARVLKDDGMIVLIAPSAGPIHRYPVDCYRFYPDSYRALAKYTGLHVVALYLDDRGPWKDLVGVFAKKPLRVADLNATGLDKSRWSLNRAEENVQATFDVPKHEDEACEILRGKRPYLEVLQALHEGLSPSLYLEIGVRHGKSLRLAKGQAIAVDPAPACSADDFPNTQLFKMTSDDFFDLKAPSVLKDTSVDLAFIDGMHLFEFALRDFMNIERYASPSTVVVVDDVFPNHPLQASRVRQTAAWTGDIWKLGLCLAECRPDLTLTFLDTHPTGLLLVSGLNPKNRTLRDRYNPIVRQYREMNIEGDHLDRLIGRTEALDPTDEQLAKILASVKPRP